MNWTANSTLRERNRTENETLDTAPKSQHTETKAESDLSLQKWIGIHKLAFGTYERFQRLEDCSEGEGVQNRCVNAERSQASIYSTWDAFFETFTLQSSLRYDGYSDIEGRATYRFALSKYFFKHFGAKSSYATGYRPPTLYELFDPSSVDEFSAANSDLEVEKSISRDIAVFLEWVEKFYAEITYFEQEVQDNIIAVSDPNRPALFRFENVSKTETKGYELLLNWNLGLGFRWNASYTNMEPLIKENDEDDERFNGNQIPGVARESWKTGIHWIDEKYGAYFNVRYVGKRFIDQSNIRFLKPYQVVDAGFNFPLPWGFEGGFEGRNLTNETYSEIENFPVPGRQLFISLKWKIG